MAHDMDGPRLRMVDQQIVARGVHDPRVLDAMRRVPRELFVPELEINRAFADGPLPIGQGQTISQPYIVAYMTELMALSGHERVLEIGTGSGYQTAVLAELAGSVFTIERIPKLAATSRKILTETLKLENITFKVGDGREGWPEAAPFDAILVTAAPEAVPTLLEQQLGNPGVMVLPVGKGVQRILRIRMKDGCRSTEDLIHVSFVPCV